MRKKVALVILVIGLIPLGWLVDDIPYNLDITAKIYPAQRWVLLKDTDGSLISTLYNYKTGTVNNVRSYKLDNGDVVHIELVPKKTKGVNFQPGDTIALLHSSLIDERIALVKSQLQELRAYLRVDETGSKAAEVDQSREQLRFAEQQLELETKNYRRVLPLYQQKVISPLEFNLQETLYEQAKIQVEISRKALEVAQTGVKPEQIKFTKARIETAAKELQSLERQKQSHTLISPISGKADFNVTPEEVISIEDTSVYVLQFPVRLSEKKYISSFSKISVVYAMGTDPVYGNLIDISDRVEYMAGEQLVFAKAILPKKATEISSGMFLRCKVECDRVNLYEYVRRVIIQSLR